MLLIENLDYTIVILISLVIIICSVCIVVSVKIQNKQKKKYEDCLKLINENEQSGLGIKNVMDNDNIKIDENIDINKLTSELYQLYISMLKDLNKLDPKVVSKLDGYIKEFYLEKIEIFKDKRIFDIVDNIELKGYSIVEYEQDKLKLRININCCSYKKNNEIIVNGSSVNKVEQIVLVTYNKINENWLISNIERVYEKKLGD